MGGYFACISAAQASSCAFIHGRHGRLRTGDTGARVLGRSIHWTGKDNGRDVSWRKATQYCRDLRLAGHSEWRLATLAELNGIYDRSANAPGLAGPGQGRAVTWHVKGNLFLTGNQWSSNRRNDDRGHPSGYEWYFDFNDGRSNNQPSGFLYSSSFMRALCVRASGR